jgi:hypothetical protein
LLSIVSALLWGGAGGGVINFGVWPNFETAVSREKVEFLDMADEDEADVSSS